MYEPKTVYLRNLGVPVELDSMVRTALLGLHRGRAASLTRQRSVGLSLRTDGGDADWLL